jgi:hypothetical protein
LSAADDGSTEETPQVLDAYGPGSESFANRTAGPSPALTAG